MAQDIVDTFVSRHRRTLRGKSGMSTLAVNHF